MAIKDKVLSINSIDKKRILFNPYEKQAEFIKAVLSGKYNFLCYGGAAGGGKTFVSLALLITMCRIYPQSKWVVIRSVLPRLKDTTIPSFFKLLPRSYLYKYTQDGHKFIFKNGSQIQFMAEDYANDKEFNKFYGLEVNGFLLEQIEELEEGLLNICFIRAGRHFIEPYPKPIILATVNPTMNWVKKRIYLPYLQNTLPKEWYYLPAKITDNPKAMETKDYLKQFDNLDPLVRQRLIDGDWDAFAVNKPFLYCFDESKHVSDKAVRNEKTMIYLSFDFNVDPSVCIVWQEGEGFIHYIDEIYLENSNLFEICERIKIKYANSFFMVTGDASGMSRHHTNKGNINSYTIIKQELFLGGSQMKIPSSNPPIDESRTLCNAILANHNEILFNPTCKKLIEDLKYTEVNDEGKIDCKGNKHRGHLLDAFRYSLNTFHNKFLINRN